MSLAMTPDQLKMMSLVVFTVQNAAFVLLMRLSKVLNSHYNSTVAVLVTEMLKLPLSVLLLVYEKRSLTDALEQLRADILRQPLDTLKIAVPALLYTVQNNALFIGLEHLEAAVFQVTYQLKTLTTAVLTVLLLNRKLVPHQWFALLLLMAGTVLVQESKPSSRVQQQQSASSFAVGVAATVTACVCSSVASVYLEKILIESKPSIWVRNAQLCLFTIPIAFGGTLLQEDKYIIEDGTPLHGFTGVVWAAILTNAVGGMIVAAVMKFAGNILRNFAQACAIILGGIGSWAMFDFQVTSNFVLGVALVIFSIFIYGSKVEQLAHFKSTVLGYLGISTQSGEAEYTMVATEDPKEAPQDEEASPAGTQTEANGDAPQAETTPKNRGV